MVVSIESEEERLLMPKSMLGMDIDGRDDVIERIFVMLASMEPREVGPELDCKPDREEGRLGTSVICESEVPVRLLVPDAPGRKVVMEPKRDDIEVRGFVAIVVELTTGMLPGPITTARLDIKMTVLVPLRVIPADRVPSPLVKVQTPSV
jgi:hypothetical protein